MTDLEDILSSLDVSTPTMQLPIALYNHADFASLERLLEVLLEKKNCSRLSLNKVAVSGRSRTLLDKVLLANQGITDLKLIKTRIFPFHVLRVSGVRRLFMQDLDLPDGKDKLLNSWIQTALPVSLHMHRIQPGSNSIDNIFLDSLNSDSLVNLTLSHINLRHELEKGCLVKLIACTSNLLHLSIESSFLTDGDWKCLSNSLVKNDSLVVLDVSGTNLERTAAEYLSTYLAGGTNLEVFRAVNIGNEALTRLCMNLGMYQLREFLIDVHKLANLENEVRLKICEELRNNHILERLGKVKENGSEFQAFVNRNWVLKNQPSEFTKLKTNLQEDAISISKFSRLTIVGTAKSGKSSLFLALAGRQRKGFRIRSTSESSFHMCTVDSYRFSKVNTGFEWNDALKFQFGQAITRFRNKGVRPDTQLIPYSLPDEDTAQKFSYCTGVYDENTSIRYHGDKSKWKMGCLNIWDIGQWNYGLQVQNLFSVSNSVYLLTFSAPDVLKSGSTLGRELIGIAAQLSSHNENIVFILVGTSADKVDRTNPEIAEVFHQFEQKFYRDSVNLRIQVAYRYGDSNAALYIDNSCLEDKNRTDDLSELRDYVSKMVHPPKKVKGDWNVSIGERPRYRARWLSLLLTLNNEGKPLIYYAEVLSRCANFGIPETECKEMVKTLSDAGSLLWILPLGKQPAGAGILNTVVCVNPPQLVLMLEKLSQGATSNLPLKMPPNERRQVHLYGIISDEWLEEMIPPDMRDYYPHLKYILHNSMMISSSFRLKNRGVCKEGRLVPFALTNKQKIRPLLHTVGVFYIRCRGQPRIDVYQKLICYFVTRSCDQGTLEDADFSAEWSLFPKLFNDNGLFIDFEGEDMIRVSSLLSSGGVIQYGVQLARECLEKIKGTDLGTEILFVVNRKGTEYFVPLEDIEAGEETVSIEGEVFNVSYFDRFFLHQQNPTSVKETSEIGKNTDFDCFLSHSWGKDQVDHKKVIQYAEILEQAGLKCWIDEKHMGKQLVKSMTDGIRNSKVFVVFLTKAYIERLHLEDTNVFKEFNYATIVRGVNRFVVISIDPEVENLLHSEATRPHNYFFHCNIGMRYDWSTPEAMAMNQADVVDKIRMTISSFEKKRLPVDPFSTSSFEDRGDSSGLGTKSRVWALYQTALNGRKSPQPKLLGFNHEVYDSNDRTTRPPNATTSLAVQLATFSLCCVLELALRLSIANPVRARALSFLCCIASEIKWLTIISIRLANPGYLGESAEGIFKEIDISDKASVNDPLLRLAVQAKDEIFDMFCDERLQEVSDAETADPSSFSSLFMSEVLKLRNVKCYDRVELFGKQVLEGALSKYGWENCSYFSNSTLEEAYLVTTLNNIEVEARTAANQFYWDVEHLNQRLKTIPYSMMYLSAPDFIETKPEHFNVSRWISALCTIIKTYSSYALEQEKVDSRLFQEVKTSTESINPIPTVLKSLTAREQPFLEARAYFHTSDKFLDWLEKPSKSIRKSEVAEWSRYVDISIISPAKTEDILLEVELQVAAKLLKVST